MTKSQVTHTMSSKPLPWPQHQLKNHLFLFIFNIKPQASRQKEASTLTVLVSCVTRCTTCAQGRSVGIPTIWTIPLGLRHTS